MPPCQGCPRSPAPVSEPTGVHRAGPEAFSAGPAEGAALLGACLLPARPPPPAGLREGRRGVGAARRAHLSCGRKGSWAGPATAFAAASVLQPLGALSPVLRLPKCRLACLATGAGAPGKRRAVGEAHRLGKPLLSFGKRCRWLGRRRGGGLGTPGCVRCVPFGFCGTSKGRLAGSATWNPAPPVAVGGANALG